ncbi:MAG: serine hydroxymethyltransferase [Candidatus Aenigmarchaeota archaeon CG_4_10_14_0_8_um_filter_37_24]|nr:serine hydroxymethyltransferase [Candidatus Aenigmarchaeota archaeon]PIV68940.1 MAG: serine hydroxymethyltransferase [Candidatus Aenigmarchaeota archaeon CG01_land_8_20_14_3_00_37_9]PIW41363.1 MAG: serine hydroxymethyltransferase [Candidatus Aenigmarchaeota archaeon CG15_BIG_FIL_POST_REV_8_21_14_020_37_27]PIX50388.1 MAG: serine hydroxymethyltransferase [Candidatus Aenigmarchaeota archaeon CG_4_8_14_3_um_filter_37_24]PIY36457.1 MAG: serine hydroxymethyltransferase [Candidatus Aenigmarchaeota 
MKWFRILEQVEKEDPEVARILKDEILRQENTIELIASENFVSPTVMQAQASVMTNKYAEGYPGKRYYGGCEFYDQVEDLARERVKKLFHAEHANVQPHSGSQANMGVYFAMLEVGDKILSMDLSHGGHLTHGSPVNFSGKHYNVHFYGVDPKTEVIDYDEVMRIAKEVKPKMIVCGASAYPRTIDFEEFREIADEVNAYLLADVAHIAGLIVGGIHPSPFPHCDFVTTTTQKTLRGPRGGVIMCKKEYAEKIDKAIFPGIQGGPLMNTIAAKAVAFKEAMKPSFKKYQEQIVKNAKALAQELVEQEFRLVSGGTDNHLMLVDLRDKGMTGKEAQAAFEEIGITVNKNVIPFDPQPMWVTSGVRLGTPATTTRGMKELEMQEIGRIFSAFVKNRNDEKIKQHLKERVSELCGKFPLYY